MLSLWNTGNSMKQPQAILLFLVNLCRSVREQGKTCMTVPSFTLSHLPSAEWTFGEGRGPEERLQLRWCFAGEDRDLVCGDSSAGVSKVGHREGLQSTSQRRKGTKGMSWDHVSSHYHIVHTVFWWQSYVTGVGMLEIATGFFLECAERACRMFRMPEVTLSPEKCRHSASSCKDQSEGDFICAAWPSGQQELLLTQAASPVISSFMKIRRLHII